MTSPREEPAAPEADVSPPGHAFVPLDCRRFSLEETLERARGCYGEMSRRRTTRHFSREAVPREAIEYAIRTAGTAVWK